MHGDASGEKGQVGAPVLTRQELEKKSIEGLDNPIPISVLPSAISML